MMWPAFKLNASRFSAFGSAYCNDYASHFTNGSSPLLRISLLRILKSTLCRFSAGDVETSHRPFWNLLNPLPILLS
jgi:hypothetical protein